MNNKEIMDSIESVLEGRSDEVKKSIIDFFAKQLQDEQMQSIEQENTNTQTDPLPLSSVPEPSLRVKHILKIKTDLDEAEETLRWLSAYSKTSNNLKFDYYLDCFLEFVIKNLTKEDAVQIMRKAILEYELVMLPSRLFNFDGFHKQFGAYIMTDEFQKRFY